MNTRDSIDSSISSLKASAIIDLTINCLDYDSSFSYDADYEKSTGSCRVTDDEDPTIAVYDEEDAALCWNESSASRWDAFECSKPNKFVEDSPVAAQRKLSFSMRWSDPSILLDESPGAPSRRVSLKDLPPQYAQRRRSRMSGCSIASIPTNENEPAQQGDELPSPPFRRVSLKDLPPEYIQRRRSRNSGFSGRISGISMASIPMDENEPDEGDELLVGPFRRVSLKDLPPEYIQRRRSRYSEGSMMSIPQAANEDETENETEKEEQTRGETLDMMSSAAIARAELRAFAELST